MNATSSLREFSSCKTNLKSQPSVIKLSWSLAFPSHAVEYEYSREWNIYIRHPIQDRVYVFVRGRWLYEIAYQEMSMTMMRSPSTRHTISYIEQTCRCRRSHRANNIFPTASIKICAEMWQCKLKSIVETHQLFPDLYHRMTSNSERIFIHNIRMQFFLQ